MRIGLIVDTLDDNIHGAGNYVYNITNRILDLDKRNEYVLIHTKNPSLTNPYHDIFSRCQELIIKPPPLVTKWTERMIVKYLSFSQILKREDFDLIHEMSDLRPMSYIPSLKVITSHGVATRAFKEPLAIWKKLSREVNYNMIKGIFKKTIEIITPSNSTKRDIIKYYGVSPDRISVIYHGVNKEIFKPIDNVKDIKERYQIGGPFILYVGRTVPSKNVEGIIKAFHKLKKRKIPHKLVIVSAKDYGYSKILSTIKEFNLQSEIVFAGTLPHENLAKVYNAADLFVFPSYYESFALPPLEAMACGTPVITSNTSSLPEQVGDAAITVDPRDFNRLAEAMYEVLTNEGLRKDLIQRGLSRAKMFTWERCAQETLRIYDKVCAVGVK